MHLGIGQRRVIRRCRICGRPRSENGDGGILFDLLAAKGSLHGPSAPCGRRKVGCCWRTAVTGVKDTFRLESKPIVGDRPPAWLPFKLQPRRDPSARGAIERSILQLVTNGGNRSRPMGCTRSIEKTRNAVR